MDRYEFYDKINSYKKNDELKHYGTIGQKWGVRHWQNADGTFNTAGKERYFGSKGNKKALEILKKDLESKGYEEVTPEFNYNIPKKYEQYRNALHAEVSRQLVDVIKNNIQLDIPDEQKYPKKVNVDVDDNGHFKIDFEYDDPKIGGFGFREIRPNEQNLNLRKEEGEKGYQNIKALEKMSNDEIHDFIKSVFDNNINFEGAFGSQPGADKAKEEANSDLFSKKNENGRSEVADKMENAAKQIRDEGNEKLADETEKTAKEMRDATSNTADRKNMTKEEKKELRRAANNCWKVANKNAWVSWLLFGLPGYAINSIINWRLVKETARQEGLSGDSKEWSASDWNKITNSIMDKYPRKYKREIKKRDATNV